MLEKICDSGRAQAALHVMSMLTMRLNLHGLLASLLKDTDWMRWHFSTIYSLP